MFVLFEFTGGIVFAFIENNYGFDDVSIWLLFFFYWWDKLVLFKIV